jgi:hypothetical protein
VRHFLAASAIALVFPAAVSAQSEAASPPPGRAPAPAAPAGSPICTDRPTKSNGACTVDPGVFQVEADLANATFQRLDGVTTNTWLAINPTLKYGLAPNLDVELNIAPVEIVRIDAGPGADHTYTGVSDLFFRAKWEFLNTTGGVWQAALIPYLKAPTARVPIGNGEVEGGVYLPVTYKISNALSLTAQAEADDFANAIGPGHHANAAQTLSVAVSLPRNWTVFGELWGDWNFDPAGEVSQYSADLAAAVLITPRLQLDGGVNIGLNRTTPGVNVYVGVSRKF